MLNLLYGRQRNFLGAYVAWAEAPPSARRRGRDGVDALTRKRQFLWRNDARNRRVAQIARSLQQRDVVTLAGYGLRLEDLLQGLPAGDAPSVCVLVESPEHGRELQRFLPGWRLRQGCSASGSRHDAPIADREICTMMAAVDAGVSTDVLLRADGTRDWPYELRVVFPRRANNVPGAIAGVLIDLDDQFDDAARRDTHSRRCAYFKAGWQVLDEV